MKYIKSYESTINDIQINDFVVCDPTNFVALKIIIANNIGILEEISNNKDEYSVKYPNQKENVVFWESEILFHSPNKEDAEQFLINNKYNL